MKVKELIERLSKEDPELECFSYEENDDFLRSLDEVNKVSKAEWKRQGCSVSKNHPDTFILID